MIHNASNAAYAQMEAVETVSGETVSGVTDFESDIEYLFPHQ